MRAPRTDDGLVIGNAYNKYESRNPISRWLTRGFLQALDRLVAHSQADLITEVGCGEGYLARHLARQGRKVVASDVSRVIVEEAAQLTASEGLAIDFYVADIYDLDPMIHANELVMCCEVLEHLEAPERALQSLLSIANPFLLLSVPHEPIWRLLNICRLRYLTRLGNTPGHVQGWSQRGFLRFLRGHADIVQVASPFPWTMVLLRRRG